MSEKAYTLAEIKAAFWKTFHERGEFWLNYLGTEQENEDSTAGQWRDFTESLEEVLAEANGLTGTIEMKRSDLEAFVEEVKKGSPEWAKKK